MPGYVIADVKSGWPASLAATYRFALAARPREPSFEDSSRQRGMSHAALSRKRTESLEIFLVKAQRDLLRARRANLDVEIFQLPRELLHAVARPEVALFVIASKGWNLALLFGCCRH